MNRYFGVHTLDGEWHALLPRYLVLADRVVGKRVLDIGCGTGIGSSMLLELGARHVDGIDHRPAVLEIGRMKHAKEGLDFHVMFWEELDFADDVFDVVVCFDPTSPVTDPSLISEIIRVLKPGGEYVCAIERSDHIGLEEALPKYGYADAAESVDVHPTGARVPQIGELTNAFDVCHRVVQRPSLSFLFDVSTHPSDRQGATRKVDNAGENGTFIPGGSDFQADEGRWLSLDSRLENVEGEQANVELWFCGGEQLQAPPLKEVTLPYYGLARRIHTMIGTLQERQLNPGGAPGFDEVVDPEPGTRERQVTSEFKVISFDNEDTGVHARNDLGLDFDETTARDDDLGDQLQQLAGLYSQVKEEFQNMVVEAQGALAERDEYIAHLVNTVHTWEQRFRSGADGLDDDDPPTGEIFVDDSDEQTTIEREALKPSDIKTADDADEDTQEKDAPKPRATKKTAKTTKKSSTSKTKTAKKPAKKTAKKPTKKTATKKTTRKKKTKKSTSDDDSAKT